MATPDDQTEPEGSVERPRRLPFEGTQNFRDLGGYPTRSGGRTRWGQLFRADALHKLTADDLVQFAALGVRTVYDLRGDAEQAEMPNPVESVNLPLLGDGQRRGWAAGLRTHHDGERFLRDVYVGMLRSGGPLFGRLFVGLAQPDGTPAVFHCHAGKDRTGITGALVLLALGVEREAVLDDFVLSARYPLIDDQLGSFQRLIDQGVSPEAAAGMGGAPRWTMAETLDALEEQHGGIERYLADECGVDPAVLVELRGRLLT